MKRKKITLFLLMLSLFVGLTSCAKRQKIIYLSEEEFMAYGAMVELTVENWTEFFELQPGQVMETYNSGGTYRYQYMYLAPKEFCVVLGEQAELAVCGTKIGTTELYEKDSGELVLAVTTELELAENVFIGEDKTAGKLALIYEEDKREVWYRPDNSESVIICTSIDKDGEIRELDCDKAAGRVSSFLVPEKVWNVDEDGVRYLCIGEADSFFRIYEPTFYEDTRRYLRKTGKLGGGV